ncbi:hypothetical protein [Paracoccus sulfuroxidans]|uniref:hypothetical protein n=1 Tax=Paracoccus sulfuroxidans TaxID=384678 RepID=UPI0011A50B96|nr:hypothetical protein [Paracoccus sulfuroxidans]
MSESIFWLPPGSDGCPDQLTPDFIAPFAVFISARGKCEAGRCLFRAIGYLRRAYEKQGDLPILKQFQRKWKDFPDFRLAEIRNMENGNAKLENALFYGTV